MNTYSVYGCIKPCIEYKLLYKLNKDENQIIENYNLIFVNYFMLKNIIYALTRNYLLYKEMIDNYANSDNTDDAITIAEANRLLMNYLGTFYNFNQYIDCNKRNIFRTGNLGSFEQKYKIFEEDFDTNLTVWCRHYLVHNGVLLRHIGSHYPFFKINLTQMEEKIKTTQDYLCKKHKYENLSTCKYPNECDMYKKCKINNDLLLFIKKNKCLNISLSIDKSIESSKNNFISLLNAFSYDIYKNMENNCLKYRQLVNKLQKVYSEYKENLYFQEEGSMLYHKLEKNRAENYVLNNINNDTKNFIKKLFNDYRLNTV